MLGREGVEKQFPDKKLSGLYIISRTRINFPDRTPGQPGDDSFVLMAERGLLVIDRVVTEEIGGTVDVEKRKAMLIEAGNSKGIVSRDWKYVANRVIPEVAKQMKARPGEVFWTGVDHHNYGNEKMYPSYWDADQLYDLNNDLHEQMNLANNPKYAAQLKAMQPKLSKMVDGLPHTFGEF